jgi:hypothetical protein
VYTAQKRLTPSVAHKLPCFNRKFLNNNVQNDEVKTKDCQPLFLL